MKVINLLPKKNQQELRYEAMLRDLWTVVIASFLSFALVFIVQFGVNFYLKLQAQEITVEISQLQSQVNKQDNNSLKNKVTAQNNLIGDYLKLAEATPKWSQVIEAFVSLPPLGVKINSFNVDGTDYSINITGYSPTRDLVIQTYNNILSDTADFSNIDYPFDNVVDPTNINFHNTFNFNPKLLK